MHKPTTASEWYEHAEMLHGRGLEAIDLVENLKDTPTDVARVHVEHPALTRQPKSRLKFFHQSFRTGDGLT
jgi:hypothetical protein